MGLLQVLFANIEDAIPERGFGRAVALSVILGTSLAAVLFSVSSVASCASSRAKAAKLAADAKARREIRDKKRHAATIDISSVPKDIQERILSLSAVDLVAAMHDKSDKITAKAAMITYCDRARRAGELLSCNAEEFFDEGIRAAELADERIASGNARQLEGLPFSVKDCVHLAGAVSTCGTAARAMKVQGEDAVVVSALKHLGAIPFVRGNVPQSLMLPESVNAIWGRALNPWDNERTPYVPSMRAAFIVTKHHFFCRGGSSGGDAALVAARAAPIAIGTDIGGSIRNPANFCGIVGFKPTAGRISKKGQAVPRKGDINGQEAIRGCAGPLARTVQDAAMFMRAAMAPLTHVMDPLALPIAFREELFAGGLAPRAQDKPLKVAYYATDDFFFACPTAQRAVVSAADALRTLPGVEVVPLNVRPGLMKELAVMYYAIMGSDGGLSEFKGGLDGEPLHEMYRQLDFMANLPGVLRPVLRAALTLMGEPRPASILKVAHGKDVKQFWYWLAQRSVLKQELMQELKSQGIHAVITPGFGVPALKHGLSAHLNVAAAYNFIYNLLDMPAGIVPVTRVREGEDVYSAPPGQQDRYEKVAKANAQGSVGIPVGVQVVGMPYMDEVVLRVMAVLESALPESTASERTLGPVKGLDV